ncbi:GNAT family N-acetyltransferase [Actinomadura keratinilytica]|uniref:GNAT family N-acetyltransferase n=1 Tax=Actinomadura keratinilytica TaxID=547461 RepID=UPI00360A5C89
MFGPLTEPLGTSRLLLEPLAAHHAEEMAEALADPRLHRYIGGRPPTAAELRARYARLAAGPARSTRSAGPTGWSGGAATGARSASSRPPSGPARAAAGPRSPG